MEKSLRLLMADGHLEIRFRRPLTTDQAAALRRAAANATTVAELREAVDFLAKCWAIEIEMDS